MSQGAPLLKGCIPSKVHSLLNTVHLVFCKQANSFSRCDQYPDCEDYSDEALCWLVGKPKNYEKDFAPFTQSANGSLEKVPVEMRVIVGFA